MLDVFDVPGCPSDREPLHMKSRESRSRSVQVIRRMMAVDRLDDLLRRADDV